jgi:hypothetical protein
VNGRVIPRLKYAKFYRDVGNRGEKAPVTQASACVSWLIQPLLWRSSSRLFYSLLDRTLSYRDRFGAKWRRRFRRKERS